MEWRLCLPCRSCRCVCDGLVAFGAFVATAPLFSGRKKPCVPKNARSSPAATPDGVRQALAHAQQRYSELGEDELRGVEKYPPPLPSLHGVGRFKGRTFLEVVTRGNLRGVGGGRAPATLTDR